MNLTFDIKCAWFELTGVEEDIIYQLFLEGKILHKSDGSTSISKLLSEEEIIEKISEKCRYIEWDDAIESLKAIRRQSPNHNFWFGLGGYRPFYLLLFD